MPRFAANLTMMFNEVPFKERFGRAAEAGFDAVEFLFPYSLPPEEVAYELQQNALTAVLFNFPAGNWGAGERGFAALPSRRGEMDDALRTGLRYAKATGTRRLHLMAGLADPDDQACNDCFRDNVRRCAEELGAHGIDLLLEPINTRSMPGYYLCDFTRAVELIDTLSLPNLKLQFDLFHRQILHGDVTTALRTLMPIIGHIQIAAVPSRHEPDLSELDSFFLIREIDRLGYDGHIGCEYVPSGRTEDGLSWFAPFRGRRNTA